MLIRAALRVAFGSIALLAAVLLLLLLLGSLGLAIPVGPLRGALERSLTGSMGRPVSIGGLAIVPAWRPELRLSDAEISSPTGYEAPLLRVGEARASVSLGSLLQGELRILELHARGLAIVLLEQGHAANWRAGRPPGDAPKPDRAALPSVGIERVRLEDFSLAWTRDGRPLLDVRLHEAVGTLPAEGISKLQTSGSFLGHPARVEAEAGSLDAMLAAEAPWPLSGSGTWGEADVAVDGHFGSLLRFADLRFDAKVSAERLDRLGELLEMLAPDLTLPSSGPVRAEGALRFDEKILDLAGVQAHVGESHAVLDLAVAFGGRLGVAGQIQATALDLKSLLVFEDDAGDGTDDAASGSRRPLDGLRKLDVDVRLGAERLTASNLLPIGLESSWQLNDAGLRAEVRAVGSRTEAALEVDADLLATPPKWTAALAADVIDAAELALLIGVDRPTTGEFRAVSAQLESRGETTTELLESLEVALDVGEGRARVERPDGSHVSLVLAELDVAGVAGAGLKGAATLRLLDRPVEARLELERPALLLQGGEAGVSLLLNGSGAKLAVDGTLGLEPRRADLGISLAGGRAGDLSAWLGVSPEAEPAYGLQGRVRAADRSWRVRIDEFYLGGTRGRGVVRDDRLGDDLAFEAGLHLGALHAAELLTVFESPRIDARLGDSGLSLDAPVFPAELQIYSGRLDVDIARLVDDWELGELSLSAELEPTGLLAARVLGSFAGNDFEARGSADGRGAKQRLRVEITSKDVDLDRLNQALGLVEGGEAEVRDLSVTLEANGNTLAEWVDTTRLESRMRDGRAVVRDANSGATTALAIREGRIHAVPGGPLRATWQGTIQEQALRLDLSTGTLRQLLVETDRIPLALGVTLGATRADLSAQVALPLVSDGLETRLELRGPDLGDLSDLLDLDLPPIGPFALGGRLRVVEQGYELRELHAELAETRLEGRADLVTLQDPPALTGVLHAPVLQIDELNLPEWSLFADEEPSDEAPADEEELRPLLDPEVLEMLDASISLRVDELRAGPDTLGAASAELRLDEGRLELDPVRFAFRAGSADAGFSYAVEGDVAKSDLFLRVADLDYGVASRLLDPESDASGHLDVLVDLRAEAPTGEPLLAHADGRLDLAMRPDDLGAEIVELWSVNLLLALLPVLQISEAWVNCVVAQLDLTDGVARPDAMVLDTTRVRVEGEGEIDFRGEKLDIELQPHPKVAELLSLQTPVHVKGRFEDFHTVVAPKDLVGTTVQFVASPILAPLGWLFRRPIPGDGADVCNQPMRERVVR